MNHAINRFSLDVHSEISQIQLDVRRWETARSLYISLTENGMPYEITQDCTAEIAICRPDGSILKNVCEIVDNEIHYDFTLRTALTAGMLECEIRLMDYSGELLTSPQFSILVHSTIYDNGDAVEQEVVNANTVKSANPGYAEVFMWSDGNPDGEDRVGYFLTADTDKSAAMVKKADKASSVLGVAVAAPGFASNAGTDRYDDEKSMLIRSYTYVGLLGFAPVIDNGSCSINSRCRPGDDGTAVPDESGDGYLVVERLDSSHVLILLELSGMARKYVEEKLKTVPTPTEASHAANKEYVDGRVDNISESLDAYVLERTYPIGSIYMSVVETSPASLFGGTWEQLKERFLLGAGATYENGKTGGAATVKLTVDQIPSHRHGLWGRSKYAIADTASGVGLCNEANGSSSYKTDYIGGGEAHNNMPPYLVVYMWKRIEDPVASS